MSEMTLGHLLSERARLTPESEAIIDDKNRYTFDEFNQRVDIFASHLSLAGVGHGDRIALLARNSEMHATTVLAAVKLGAIAVVVNWRLAPPEMEHILEDSEPVALVYQHEFSPLLDKISTKVLPDIQICDAVCESNANEPIVYATIVTADEEREKSCLPINVAIDVNDPAVIMYTSGTTGRSKGAVITHKNLYTAAHSASCTIDWNRNQRFLLGAPMFHIGGLFYLFGNIMRGSTTVMLPDFKPALTWELIETEQISMMMTVPAMLRAMFDAPEIDTVDRSHLEYLICGGASVSSELVREGAAHNIDVQIVYGATEFTGPITFWINKDDPNGLGSAGRAIMNAEVAAFDVQTQKQVCSGRIGELWLRGPMTFAGYWRNEKASAEVLVNGWYRTGDVGHVDSEGRVYLKDRLKDVIISGGENIYPAEIEAVMSKHAAVAEVTVVGHSDERWGEVPVAYVVQKPGVVTSEQDLMGHSKEYLASYKTVKKVVFVDALPKNSVGKVLRRQLRES